MMTATKRGVLVLMAMGSLAMTGRLPRAAADDANPDSPKPGLVWVLFNASDFKRPAETGTDAQVNLDTGRTIQDYSRLWMGLLKAPIDGRIRLIAEADDGVQVWIDEKLTIDGWGLDRARQGEIATRAGQLLPLEIRFFQNGGEAHLRLFWQYADGKRELIPASALAHRWGDEVAIERLMGGQVQVQSKLQIKGTIYDPSARPASSESPITLRRGPHLFIDDFLIAECTNVRRRVNVPKRQLDEPVVTGKGGKGDDCFQPYLEVIRDPRTKRFRIWYGVPENTSRSHVATMESDDGIHWIRPHRVLKDPSPIQFGVSVIDEGPEFADPAKRFKLGYYSIERPGGLRIAVSPNGLDFVPLVPRVVLHHDHDITNIYRDAVRNCYMAIGSTYITGPTWSGQRRVTLESHSQDLVHWASPWLILTPNDHVEPGQTQFYAMCGFLQRGDLLIGAVKVLHDDYAADPGGPKAGVGWTSLAWTRDGEHWTRDREVFFDRHPDKAAWDHAMAWIDCQLPVGDEVYLYYGGYKQGHKINRFEERQIGLVRMKRDRYVARQAGATAGLLRTPPVVLDGGEITVNVDAAGGEVSTQIEDLHGKPIEGLSFADCQPIKTDAIDAAVRWRGALDRVKGRPVRLAFLLRNASLFGFSVR